MYKTDYIDEFIPYTRCLMPHENLFIGTLRLKNVHNRSSSPVKFHRKLSSIINDKLEKKMHVKK